MPSAQPKARVLLAALTLTTTALLGCGERNPIVTPDAGLPDLRPLDARADSTTFPDQGQVWTCGPSKLGIQTCLRKRENGGLPKDVLEWQCHLGAAGATDASTWYCHGFANAPAVDGWSCVPFSYLGGPPRWRCTKPDTAADRPPYPGPWVCVKGDNFGGTRCQRVADKPTLPPDDFGGACVPGQKRWCDNTSYDGWSTVTCDPITRQWRTKSINGKLIIDCSGPSDRVPSTVCAYYHIFFNAACCERQDCVVPEETSGQSVKKSSGGSCAFCNPLKPECTGSGAQCIVTNNHESFCGKHCTADADCAGPESASCMQVKLKVGSTKLCVPTDLSCYY